MQWAALTGPTRAVGRDIKYLHSVKTYLNDQPSCEIIHILYYRIVKNGAEFGLPHQYLLIKFSQEYSCIFDELLFHNVISELVLVFLRAFAHI